MFFNFLRKINWIISQFHSLIYKLSINDYDISYLRYKTLFIVSKVLFRLTDGFEKVDLNGLRLKCVKNFVVWIKEKMVRFEWKVYESLWMMW